MAVFHFLLSFFIEFGGLVGFLIFAHYFNFFVGVYVLVFCTILSLILSHIRDKRIPMFSLIIGVTVLFFSGLTLYFNNPYWVVFENTLYNFTFAFFAFIGYFKDKPLMKKIFPTMFAMTDKGWHIMSLRWAFFFLISGFFNEYFWHVHGESVWLTFRMYLIVVSTFFGLYQFNLSKKERLENSTVWGLPIRD